jgi:hypothetical protein
MTGGERHLPAMNCFSVEVMDIAFHVPPIKWKGDILGHIGINDVFFYVISGECYMKIEDDCFIVKSGQIVYLPKGKLRAYTRVTEDFVMYEIAFSVTADGKELFSSIGLDEGDYAVDAEDGEMLKNLFEGASRYEFNRSGFFDIAASAKCFEIIAEYIRLRLKSEGKKKPFSEVLFFMKKHLGENITLSELSDVAFMQKNYFDRVHRWGILWNIGALLCPSCVAVLRRSHKVASVNFSAIFQKHLILKSVRMPDNARCMRFHAATTCRIL